MNSAILGASLVFAYILSTLAVMRINYRLTEEESN